MGPITPEPVRVCVCAPDAELRAWLLDELALMTWIGALQLECVGSVADVPPVDLVIVELDRVTDADRRALASRTFEAPVIAIGPADGIPADRVLGARLTSRELKQAIRELLM